MEAIRNWIIDGTLAPGTALVETQLANRLGVSRVPVREALQRLGQQGLVELRPGQSAQVVRRSARDVIELLEVRSVLAGLAASLAAKHRTDQDLDLLTGIIAEAREAVDRQDWHEVGLLNSKFHAELARIGGNHQLSALIENSRFQLAWLNQHLSRRRGGSNWDFYTELVEAVRAQDGERADAMYRSYILATKELFVADYLAGHINT
jgi:DNA-binding GntR family transcriptional regulator